MNASAEVKVGAFVLLALGVLVGFVIALGGYSIGRRTTVLIDFAYTGGLKVGAPVRVSGVSVGRVAGIGLIARGLVPPASERVEELGRRASPRVRVELLVDEAVAAQIGPDSRFFVGMSGLLGESYVELALGRDPGPLGARALRGVDAPELHVMVLQLQSTMGVLSRLTAQLDGASGGGELAAALTSLVRNVDGLLAERKDELARALDDFSSAAGELKRITAALATQLGPDGGLTQLLTHGGGAAALLDERLPKLVGQAEGIMASMSDLAGKADRALNPEGVTALLTEAQALTGDLRVVAREARVVAEAVRKGQGSLGGFIADPQVFDDTKELLRELRRNPWKLLWRE